VSRSVQERFFEAWWETFHARRLSVREVIISAIETPEAHRLRNALGEIAPSDYPGIYSPHKLGKWLVRHQSQAHGGKQLFHRGSSQHQQVWQLVLETLVDAA
jgi:hypothetical protein